MDNKSKLISFSIKTVIVVLFVICIFSLESVFADEATADEGLFVVYGRNQFFKYVYERMLERDEIVTVKYVGEDYGEIFDMFEKEKFLDEIAKIDDPATSDDYDYLCNNLSKMETSMKYSNNSEAVFTLNIIWREDRYQTNAVNAKIEMIIDEYGMRNMNAYEKVKAVHDYIVNNVEYDTECKNENAYLALFEGAATCQGYSLLFYKFMIELGVDCRYITGIGISEETGPHGWNIVKLCDEWYNIDVTWDDPVYVNSHGGGNPNKKISYDYFLKGTGEFDTTHERDAKFLTDSFLSEYNMADSDFDIKKNKDIQNEYKSKNKELKWEFSEEEISGANGMHRQVRINDFSTYKNIVPNIVEGIENVSAEKGVAGTIAFAWSEFTLGDKIMLILFLVARFMVAL